MREQKRKKKKEEKKERGKSSRASQGKKAFSECSSPALLAKLNCHSKRASILLMINTGLHQNCHLDDSHKPVHKADPPRKEPKLQMKKVTFCWQDMLCKPRCECLVNTNRKPEQSVQWFCVTSVSVKSHLVCFMIFWDMKPEKHLSIFQLMRPWQSKQLAQYSGKNSSKIRMNGTSLNKNKKRPNFPGCLIKTCSFHYTVCSLSQQFLAVTEFWIILLPRETTKKV